jgi:hypothetical protein
MKKFALPFRFLLIEVTLIQYILIHLFLGISPEVDFCGYSVPHPSEPKMNVRIQTKDGTVHPLLFLSSLVLLSRADGSCVVRCRQTIRGGAAKGPQRPGVDC